MAGYFFGIFFEINLYIYTIKLLIMKQKYLYTIFSTLLMFCSVFAQQEGSSKGQRETNSSRTDNIEGLQLYPNPTVNNKVYIVTETSSSKEIEIFDILGKKVYTTTVNNTNAELNLNNLKPGVYLVKVKEKDAVATRKLVLK